MSKKIYLVLAVLGAVIPYLFFYDFMMNEGVNILSFVRGLFENGAAGGFSADLLISSVVFWVYMFQKMFDDNSPKPWLFIGINLTIGLSCALPAYLYMLEVKKEK